MKYMEQEIDDLSEENLTLRAEVEQLREQIYTDLGELTKCQARIAELEGVLQQINDMTYLEDQAIGPEDRFIEDVHAIARDALAKDKPSLCDRRGYHVFYGEEVCEVCGKDKE
jgi:chromosome segregation ATPase